jgi:hypothetical protein
VLCPGSLLAGNIFILVALDSSESFPVLIVSSCLVNALCLSSSHCRELLYHTELRVDSHVARYASFLQLVQCGNGSNNENILRRHTIIIFPPFLLILVHKNVEYLK